MINIPANLPQINQNKCILEEDKNPELVKAQINEPIDTIDISDKRKPDNYFPRWSPDDSKILFVTNRDGKYQIYVMDQDGNNQRRVSDPSRHSFYPDWSPDGKQVVFQALDTERNDYDIYVANIDGTEIKQLTDTPYDEEQPHWSPDGKKILYKAELPDGQFGGPYELWIMNPDGSEKKRLTFDNAYDGHMAWSPDGTKIAFTTTRDTPPGSDFNIFHIYTMNADGSNQRAVTKGNTSALCPSWSPDGSRIAYISGYPSGEIAVVNADGSEPKVLTNLKTDDKWPEFSPDGKNIVFTSMYPVIFLYKMHMMDSDGSNLKTFPEKWLDDQQPHYNHSGTKIAFHSTRETHQQEIYICDSDGTNVIRLTGK